MDHNSYTKQFKKISDIVVRLGVFVNIDVTLELEKEMPLGDAYLLAVPIGNYFFGENGRDASAAADCGLSVKKFKTLIEKKSWEFLTANRELREVIVRFLSTADVTYAALFDDEFLSHPTIQNRSALLRKFSDAGEFPEPDDGKRFFSCAKEYMQRIRAMDDGVNERLLLASESALMAHGTK